MGLTRPSLSPNCRNFRFWHAEQPGDLAIRQRCQQIVNVAFVDEPFGRHQFFHFRPDIFTIVDATVATVLSMYVVAMKTVGAPARIDPYQSTNAEIE